MHYFSPNFLLLILLIQAFLANCCIEHERDALLEFKASLIDKSNRLASWSGNNCCLWAGIRCSNRTGHVVELNLQTTIPELQFINGDFSYSNNNSLTGKINQSLLVLSDLKHLDLSFNNFTGNKFPNFIGAFENLKYLNLSNMGLSGSIHAQLGNLSRLQYLDLSCDTFYGPILNTNTKWLANMHSLRHLDMSGITFRESNNWVETLNQLPSLEVLVLSENNLTQISNTLTFVNFTSLRVLHISDQVFNTTMPDWLGSLPNLTDLIVQDCSLVGPYLATLGNLTSLNILALDYNYELYGMIPPLYNLNKLTHLSLSYNTIEGDIEEFLSKLSNYTLGKIEYLDMLSTNLSGTLSGLIGEMTSVNYLGLSSNNLRGTIPVGIRNLTNLVYLDLSFNFFTGLLSETQLDGLFKLRHLDLTNNSLTVSLDSNWTPSFQLNEVWLSSCLLGPKFPAWLQKQAEIDYLELVNCGIDDSIPDWFWNLSSLNLLDMNDNKLRGPLPFSLIHMTKLMLMNLGNNRLVGEIPFLPISLVDLNLSNNSLSGQLRKNYTPPNMKNSIPSSNYIGRVVEIFRCELTSWESLDLSNNNLSGHLPLCLSNFSRHLNLANNKLSGIVPVSLSCSTWLTTFKLGNNNLTGEFPLHLQYCSGLQLLDLGENHFHGTIPDWIGERLNQLNFLRLRSNFFSGTIPSELTSLNNLCVLDLANNYLSGLLPKGLQNFTVMGPSPSSVGVEYGDSITTITKGIVLEYDSEELSFWTSMDFSNNYLTGEIPPEIVVLTGLVNLNLSHNHLIGNIPFEIGNMTSLESLDFCMNNLSGTIPESISALYSLEALNFSYNNLSGSIPSGRQLQTLDDPSIYTGNPYLCGPPLGTSCGGNRSFLHGDGYNNSSSYQVVDTDKWFYLLIEFGFVSGLLIVFFILLFKASWQYAYFQMVDRVFDRVYVIGKLAFKRLREEQY